MRGPGAWPALTRFQIRGSTAEQNAARDVFVLICLPLTVPAFFHISGFASVPARVSVQPSTQPNGCGLTRSAFGFGFALSRRYCATAGPRGLGSRLSSRVRGPTPPRHQHVRLHVAPPSAREPAEPEAEGDHPAPPLAHKTLITPNSTLHRTEQEHAAARCVRANAPLDSPTGSSKPCGRVGRAANTTRDGVCAEGVHVKGGVRCSLRERALHVSTAERVAAGRHCVSARRLIT